MVHIVISVLAVSAYAVKVFKTVKVFNDFVNIFVCVKIRGVRLSDFFSVIIRNNSAVIDYA